MGQTLSNGVYLPNEGERNCYAGLASNWQILNTAVGNIAEKAPLVHTHGNITNDGKVGTNANLPLITGTGGAITAGAFGNQANTFCEGNDSRLSDARTPVAHTHTKSDVTDLLNSNFIPSANNSYDLGSSSYKWKTLNGINPGALSLPNLNYSDSNQWIDLSGNITDETGGSNEYDPTVDGWVVIRADNNPTSLRVNVHAPRPSARKYLASRTGVATPDGIMIVSVPAPAGSRVYIYFNKGSGSLDSATFITCQGNV